MLNGTFSFPLIQNESTTSNRSKPADESGSGGGRDPSNWNMGQDDCAVHGKHLPPSPRRQPNQSSPKASKQTATASAAAAVTVAPPARNAVVSKSHPHQPNSDRQPLLPVRKPTDRYSYSPLLSYRVTPSAPSPTFSHTRGSPANYSRVPAGRSRTISDPQASTEPHAQSQTASTIILRRRGLSKETLKQYQEKALQKQGNRGHQEGQNSPSRNKQSAMHVPWEKEVSKEGHLGFGLCLGQTTGSGEGVAQDQGLLKEIESMCCIGSVLNTSLQLSQVHCNNSHTQVQGQATDES